MNVAEYAEYVNQKVYPTISKVSLVLAIIVVLTMIALTIYDRKLVDRVTLRLQTGVIIYDIWLHSLPLWNRPYNVDGSPLCTFIGFQLLFFPLYYSFLNAAIGINLQLIFIHGVTITWKIEACYWIGAILLSLLISIPPLATGVIGYGSYSKCFITIEDDYPAKMFDFFTNTFIMIICMVYLIIAVAFIVFKLSKQAELVQKFRLFRGSAASVDAVKSVRFMAFRILLYPVIMIISHIGLVINQTAIDFGDLDSPELNILLSITGGLLGTLNFIAFFCDPTIHSAFKKIYLRVTTRNMFRDNSEDIEIGRPKKFSVRINLDSFDSSDSSASLTPNQAFERKLDKFIRTL